jgi:cell wall-associated NlpC family hydrolase
VRRGPGADRRQLSVHAACAILAGVTAASLHPRLTPARADLADVALRGIVEAARYVEGRPARVVAPSAPLRRAPRGDAGLDTEALMGEPVTVYDEAEGWAFARLGSDGYVGYLPGAALGPDAGAPTHRVAALRSFLYPGPNLKLPPLGHLSLGAGVRVAEVSGEYARVVTGGWLHAAHLAAPDARAADYVAVAERFLGTPYLWGGRTSLGLDCSGLVQTALAAAGVAAPRDADMQEAGLGAPLPVDPATGAPRDARRGDLVFWRGHVGILSDPETLLHANGHHMAVAVEPLAAAVRRIAAAGGGPVTSARRPPP